MNKSNKNLTEIGKRVLKYTDTYDDNVIVDGNEIKLESQLRKEIKQRERKVSDWQLMKEVAQDKARKGNTKELNDLLKIERKMRKKTNTAQRTAPKATSPTPTIPLDLIDFNEFSKIKSKPDDTLERIEADRNKPDPDVAKGLGIFFPQKF